MDLGNIQIADLWLGQLRAKSAWVGDVQVWSDAPAYLCFTAAQANSTVHLDKKGSPGAISIETSTDGSTWTDYSWTDKTGDTLTLANVGDKVYFRAKTENTTLGDSVSNNYTFKMTGKIAASGSIQTLLKADGSRTDAPAYCFMNLFEDNRSLTTAPELPATTLAVGCYWSVFKSCTALTAAPQLPATTLATQCYQYMFMGSGITAAPALPATTLANGCYNMMFQGCTSLTTAPILPATTLADSCYINMFKNCTSLTTAPALPATTLASSCYKNMFNGCTSLSSIEVAFTTWKSGATDNWLNNVAASGTFTCPAELPDTRGASNIPEGWTKADSSYPTSNLLMHFDGIDNTGAGDASHSTDTQTWANVDGSLTGYYLKRPSTTYNTSWDSKGAVLTGAYDQAFWLTDPQGNTVNALSSVDTGSFTYALAFYYDPSTVAQWRGLIGRQGHNNSSYGYNSYTYVCTNPNPYGIKMDISFGKDGNVANEQSSPDLRSYLTENSFNTIAFAYDESADTLKSFVNGQLVDTTNLSSHPPYASDVAFVLGSGAQSAGSNRTCKGKIYDFMMYSEAIADTDVAKIHDWQSARYNT